MRLAFVISELSMLVLSSMVAAVYPQTTTTGKGEAASLENPALAFGKSHSSVKTEVKSSLGIKNCFFN